MNCETIAFVVLVVLLATCLLCIAIPFIGEAVQKRAPTPVSDSDGKPACFLSALKDYEDEFYN